MAWLKIFVVFLVLSTLPDPAAASIGKVLNVTQGATLTRAGSALRLREGMDVASGDMISTNKTGVVQLLFADETKIAVGPNARMVLDVSMLRGNKKARSFTVQALGGSFRFISGKSRKRAYSIRTPSATMAVRGTTFDMWITKGEQSAMLVIEGTVRMCGSGGSCLSSSRQCSLFATNSGGLLGRPKDQAQYDKALKGGFPFILSQSRLLPAFQVDARDCTGDAVVVPRIRSDEDRQPRRQEVKEDPPRKANVEPDRSEREVERPDRNEARSSAGVGKSTGSRSSAGETSVSAGKPGSSASASAGRQGARATARTSNVTADTGP